jgi:hypothetical protein
MIQLEGPITLGGIDYSSQITSVVLNDTRATVTTPPTFGDATEVDSAGAHKRTMTINFFSSHAAASSWAELYDAIITNTAELTFTARFATGAISADNPEFTGTIIVMSLDTGGTVGELKAQSQTYPVKGTWVRDVTP